MKTSYSNRFNGMMLFILAIIFRPIVPASAQEVLDVLPAEGRNNLFHQYLLNYVDSSTAHRKADFNEALTSMEKFQQRQDRLRADYLKILGEMPEENTPLNSTVKATYVKNGYNIDLVTFESRPNHHVTGNFYYPTTGAGPYPGILLMVGHYPMSKAVDIMQMVCLLLVQNGMAVLIVDPIAEGERYQVVNPKTGKLAYVGESGTGEHSRLDVGSMLVGTSVTAYEVWDNHRGIDYLYSRPEVDTARIGCTGSSGGGAQATYLAAYDKRIKVAASNSYIMNEPTLYKTIGPQTASQNLSYEGYYGIDHPEYIEMFAPKPFMILCGTKDFFDINGTHETYAEAQLAYERLGVPQNLGYFEYDDGHDYTIHKREAVTKWFRTWFYDDTTSITEPALQPLIKADSLVVTDTGQVYYEFPDEVQVQDFNTELATGFGDNRTAFWTGQTKDSCLNMVKSLIMLDEDNSNFTAEIVETYDRGTYNVEKIKLTQKDRVPVTGLMFVPKNLAGKIPAVLYVDGRGKKTDAAAGGIIEKAYMDSGKVVFAIDVRGFGETKDNVSLNETKHANNEHRNCVIGYYVGRTFIGQRVQDIMLATDYLKTRSEVDSEEISITGIDRAGTSVLHAGALYPEFKDVEIRLWTDTSWVTIVKAPTINNNMTHVVPDAMKYYDLPDLVNAISPRTVKYSPEPVLNTGIKEIKVTGNNTLGQNYPNPFRDYTTISYVVPAAGNVTMKLYDGSGREVSVLVDQFLPANTYQVGFSGSSLKTGIYFYRLSLNGIDIDTRKMSLIRN
jgi:cephalosporin-C deacetylase-like acetyl esterase